MKILTRRRGHRGTRAGFCLRDAFPKTKALRISCALLCLFKDKGVENIMRAAVSLHAAGEQVSLQVVGDGEQGGALRQLAKELDPQGKVISMCGAVPPSAVSAFMENADILVMNSAFEGVPMTILEALSCGLPVISTDVGGIGEAVCFRAPQVTETDEPQSAGADGQPERHAAEENARPMRMKTRGNMITEKSTG